VLLLEPTLPGIMFMRAWPVTILVNDRRCAPLFVLLARLVRLVWAPTALLVSVRTARPLMRSDGEPMLAQPHI
jgi:hypothetical protein